MWVFVWWAWEVIIWCLEQGHGEYCTSTKRVIRRVSFGGFGKSSDDGKSKDTVSAAV
jgi:hypothetical protein